MPGWQALKVTRNLLTSVMLPNQGPQRQFTPRLTVGPQAHLPAPCASPGDLPPALTSMDKPSFSLPGECGHWVALSSAQCSKH